MALAQFLVILHWGGGIKSPLTITSDTVPQVVINCGIANKDTFYRANRTDTGTGVSFGVGLGGNNHGVYSHVLKKWLVHSNGSDIFIGGNKIGDIVVEQGVSGYWTYRKWASGIAECWTNQRVTATGSQGSPSTILGGYWYYTRVTFPFTFATYPMAVADGSTGTGLGNAFCITDTSGMNVNIIGNQNNSTINFYIYAIGTWK